MKFDFVSFLGGLTVGAAAAALIGLTREQKLLGQGVVAGGAGFGGFGGSYGPSGGSYAPGGFGPGVVVGPGQTAVSTSIGPSVVEQGPIEEDDVVGPIISVPPIIHDGDGALFGDSFFGVNIAPWFWPFGAYPLYQWPPAPQGIVCKKIKDEDDEETFFCQRTYPVQSVTWGPRAGWL